MRGFDLSLPLPGTGVRTAVSGVGCALDRRSGMEKRGGVARGVFLFGIYTAWSAGFPWDFANAHKYLVPLWTFRVGLVAWAVTALLIVDVWRRYSRHRVAP